MSKHSVKIRNKALYDHLLKYYDADGDGKLSRSDLAAVTDLNIINGTSIGTPDYWKRTVVTTDFKETEDLSALTGLRNLSITGQPIKSLHIGHTQLKSLSICDCPELRCIEYEECGRMQEA